MRHSVWTKSLLPEEDFVTFQEEEDKKCCSLLIVQEENNGRIVFFLRLSLSAYWHYIVHKCTVKRSFLCRGIDYTSTSLCQTLSWLPNFANNPNFVKTSGCDMKSLMFPNELHSSNIIVFIQVVQNCWCALKFTEYSSLWNKTSCLKLFFSITI